LVALSNLQKGLPHFSFLKIQHDLYLEITSEEITGIKWPEV
jgi:hypothetical protein